MGMGKKHVKNKIKEVLEENNFTAEFNEIMREHIEAHHEALNKTYTEIFGSAMVFGDSYINAKLKLELEELPLYQDLMEIDVDE